MRLCYRRLLVVVVRTMVVVVVVVGLGSLRVANVLGEAETGKSTVGFGAFFNPSSSCMQ